jgi:hypothetical protein
VVPIGDELAPGTYHSTTFASGVQFTIPTGWKVFEDEPGQFGLALMANDGPCVCLWRDIRASNESCEEIPQPGVGTSARAIATWLATHKGIVATKPKAVTIGGLSGWTLDVSLDPKWKGVCAQRRPEPTVPTLVGSGISTGVAWDVAPDSRQRLYLLDIGKDGAEGNIAINIEVCCGTTFTERMAAVTPVVESLKFDQ